VAIAEPNFFKNFRFDDSEDSNIAPVKGATRGGKGTEAHIL